jgi:uncharacterized protein with HEPN domain
MSLEVNKYLLDILESIDSIESYLGPAKDFNKFSASPLLQDAVMRRLEIIGEATNRILKIKPGITISEKRRIVGLRNKVAHEYDIISIENIWVIVVRHLPVLKSEVERLLKEK